MPDNSCFSQLSLKPELMSNLATLGYEQMTPVQAKSLPQVLNGKDVIAQAKTGSGKTAAFGLGLLQNLRVKRFRIQAMVLCPTRELADQVAKEVRKLARGIHNIKVLTLCGGVPMGPQIGSLEHGAHIIVGTPGRILDHLERGRISLEELNTLVLDEADKMLDMGFQPAIDALVAAAPVSRQSLLFSATFPEQIQSVASKILKEPVMVKVDGSENHSSISQYFYRADNQQHKLEITKALLLERKPESCVIFCNTKQASFEVADYLADFGFSSLVLNGDLEQKQREQTLVRFANKSVSILVATDVAARGLDVDKLDAVINYDIAHDPDTHVHRAGRTGRAGEQGYACSLYLDRDAQKLISIEEYQNITITDSELPALNASQPVYKPTMVTLRIDGGKKQKVRPGDILGALTGKGGINGQAVGKINVFDFCAYVAVQKSVANDALKKLETGKLKGRTFRVWKVSQ
ncbi:ATP-dependent RNA helicase DbpA [Thalassotalea sp. PS06]|uniref:ATP-dependent RNA helicase DbpA n=1 Tax=Thalassotalea sp. PS06 TaxID=2594005 RepID=UPI0011645BA5|nr:ATP-dependent RNA helicase DbpA [Thalassotalea sp. PS06]QDP02995.1 ATP-dependent RNA helicase DbpA [Thalassotalea sp. PS06]